MILYVNNSEHAKLANIAASVAFQNFKWQHAALVLYNSSLLWCINIFLRLYDKNVIIGRGVFYPNFVSRTKQYVLFGTDLQDIVRILTWMKRHQFDNTGKFIIVCQSDIWKDCNEFDAVAILWHFKILNVVIINMNQKENEVNSFTYFNPKDCMNPQPKKLLNLNICLSNGRLKCINIYPLKLKNLHRCPLLVSTFNQVPYMNVTNGIPSGADGDLLRVIAEAMNFTLNVMTPRVGNGWGKLEDNGTWTGSLADVYNDWANFSITSASVTLSRFTTFQLSVDYRVSSVVWVTHPSEVQPASLKLLRPFQSNVRIAVCLTSFMVMSFIMFLKSDYLSSLRQELNVTIPKGIIFHSWEICMGLPVSSFPANNALLCLTLFWIWYCFLIRTLYQVYLIKSLKTDVYSPEFDTIEEAIASKYPFGGGLALRDLFIDNDLIYDNWINVESNEIYTLMMKLSQGLKFVLAMNPESTKMFLDRNRNRKLHILPQVIVTTPTVVFFKKYSPLVNSLNIVLTRLRESGIVDKIYLDHTGKKIFDGFPSDNIPISLEHYTGCYAVLLVGWIISALCFAVEILMPKTRNKR